jgi:hypothetical protein
MSKGLGRVERAILAAIERNAHPQESFHIVCAVFDLKPPRDGGLTIITDAQLVSVHRALRSLRRKNLVYRCRGPAQPGKRLRRSWWNLEARPTE